MMLLRNRYEYRIWLAFVALVACGDAPEGPPFMVRDSAGIEIVENIRPSWDRSERWHVGDSWAVSIGVADGAPEYQLHQVRDIDRLDDGTLLVANDGSREIRVYDQDGTFLHSLGGYGEGPGEFRQLWAVGPYRGDSMFGYDYGLRRVNIFTADGMSARSLNIGPNFPYYWVEGALRDGSFVLNMRGGIVGVHTSPGTHPVFSRPIRLSPEGESHDTLGTFVSRWEIIGDGGELVTRYFRPHGVLAAGAERVYWGETSAFEIQQHDPSVQFRRIIRKTHTPVDVTASVIRQFKEFFLSRQFDEGNETIWRRYVEEAEYAPVLPAFSGMLVDVTGHLWVSRYHFPGETATEWEVFTPTGRWLGMVATPEGVEVLYIGDNEVIGVAKDEMDVEYVRVYDLIKP